MRTRFVRSIAAHLKTCYCFVIPESAASRESRDLMKTYCVYILASRRNGTLYIGITNSLARRVHEHKNGIVDGFTKKHGVYRLVHYEVFDRVASAIGREKQLKKWNRKWKLALIEKENPEWRDLADHGG